MASLNARVKVRPDMRQLAFFLGRRILLVSVYRTCPFGIAELTCFTGSRSGVHSKYFSTPSANHSALRPKRPSLSSCPIPPRYFRFLCSLTYVDVYGRTETSIQHSRCAANSREPPSPGVLGEAPWASYGALREPERQQLSCTRHGRMYRL